MSRKRKKKPSPLARALQLLQRQPGEDLGALRARLRAGGPALYDELLGPITLEPPRGSSAYAELGPAELRRAEFEGPAMESLLAAIGDAPESCQPARSLRQVTTLSVNARQLDLSLLACLERLERLDLSSTDLASLEGLPPLPNFRELKLANQDRLIDLGPLRALSGLEHLDLTYCKALTSDSLYALTDLRRLRRLVLYRCDGLEHLDGLRGCFCLEELSATHCPQLQGVSALAELPSLLRADLSWCQALPGIGALANSRVGLVVEGCSGLRDTTGRALRLAALRRAGSLSEEDLERLLRELESYPRDGLREHLGRALDGERSPRRAWLAVQALDRVTDSPDQLRESTLGSARVTRRCV